MIPIQASFSFEVILCCPPHALSHFDTASFSQPGAHSSSAGRLSAGIFFSKTRREEVVEVDEEPEYVQNAALGQKLPILTRGDWMRGCPEASEQTHLFSLYNKASEPSRKCNACNTVIPISKADLLTIYVSTLLAFPALDRHVKPCRLLTR